MRRVMVLATAIWFGGGCAMGQTAPATTPAEPSVAATSPADDANAAADAILRELEQVGRDMESFTADVTLTETDAMTADEFGRTGSVVYQRPGEGNARLRVSFQRKVVGERSQEHRVDYLLADGWLVERDYRGKTEVRRQVLRPGQKIDLLKLGEGPFPLPIGQDVAEVHRLFEVKLLAPGSDAPNNTEHLQLRPRTNTQFAHKFQTIDVWVDRQSHMPVRIQTLDAGGNAMRTTDLTNVRHNAAVPDERFVLPPIDQTWNRHEEPFAE